MVDEEEQGRKVEAEVVMVEEMVEVEMPRRHLGMEEERSRGELQSPLGIGAGQLAAVHQHRGKKLEMQLCSNWQGLRPGLRLLRGQ